MTLNERAFVASNVLFFIALIAAIVLLATERLIGIPIAVAAVCILDASRKLYDDVIREEIQRWRRVIDEKVEDLIPQMHCI